MLFTLNVFAQSTPSNLTTNNITTTTADLSWVDNGCSPLSGDFLVRYKLAGDTWSSGTSIITTAPANSTNLTGLSIGTDYEWRVKCNGCGGSSCWSPTAQFTTSSPQIRASLSGIKSAIISQTEAKFKFILSPLKIYQLFYLKIHNQLLKDLIHKY